MPNKFAGQVGGGLISVGEKKLLDKRFEVDTYGNMSNYPIDELHRFAEVFKALGNPNRLHIFLRLISCCPPGTKCSSEAAVRQCVGDLGQDLEIDPSTVSHHLKELRRAGLIRVERRGKHILGWVDREMVEAVADLLTGRLPADTVRREVAAK
jgi:ArsR family transcriptional regulator